MSFIKTKKGIKVIEFNCEFGDDEAINVANESDLGKIFEAIAYGSLNTINVGAEIMLQLLNMIQLDIRVIHKVGLSMNVNSEIICMFQV